jgi:hypothetical protein
MIQNTMMKDEVIANVIKVQQHLDSTSKGLGSLLLYAVPIAIAIILLLLLVLLRVATQGQNQFYGKGE